MTPIKMEYNLRGKELELEVGLGNDSDSSAELYLKINGQDYDQMMDGPIPEKPEEVLRCSVRNNFLGQVKRTSFNLFSG